MLRLRAERLGRNLRLRDVEEGTGIHVPDLSRFETGAARPYRDALRRLARFFGIDPPERLLDEIRTEQEEVVNAKRRPRS